MEKETNNLKWENYMNVDFCVYNSGYKFIAISEDKMLREEGFTEFEAKINMMGLISYLHSYYENTNQKGLKKSLEKILKR